MFLITYLNFFWINKIPANSFSSGFRLPLEIRLTCDATGGPHRWSESDPTAACSQPRQEGCNAMNQNTASPVFYHASYFHLLSFKLVSHMTLWCRSEGPICSVLRSKLPLSVRITFANPYYSFLNPAQPYVLAIFIL